MKKLPVFIVALVILTATVFSSFTIQNNEYQPSSLNPTDEFEVLITYLESNGNFINTLASEAVISADEVRKNMKNPKYQVIDIRSDSWFEYGHIKDAKNVKASDLLNYFESSITPSDYEKIVLVCYSGQSAAYYASLLSLAGYDNVYSMKWGISSWRVDFADNSWNKNIGDDFANKLETFESSKGEKGAHPTLSTGKSEPKEILKARLQKLFETPYSDFIVKSTDVFENPNNYYIVNYWDQDKYITGHIPNAIQYQPFKSLNSTADLYTLPADKKVVVYCSTGQNAAYVVAYLNVLGYDVGNIAYGANSFMNKTLKEKDWDAFTKKEINMFPVVE